MLVFIIFTYIKNGQQSIYVVPVYLFDTYTIDFIFILLLMIFFARNQSDTFYVFFLPRSAWIISGKWYL